MNDHSKEQEKHTRLKKVSAIQDDAGHWYVLPSELTSKFYELDLAIGSENETTATEAEENFEFYFSKYRTGGDLNNIQLYAAI